MKTGNAVRAVETEEELRLANDLMAKSQAADYFSAMHWLETCGASYPGYVREHTRIALRDGEVAGALRLNTETVRLGEARLKTGGIGWVSTAFRHRHKGVCTALIQDAFRYLERHKYHVAMLFGIPFFYHRFGFTTTLADYAITMDAAEAAAAPAQLRVRRAKPGDIQAVQTIHNANDTATACSLLRTGAHITNKWDRCKTLRVLTDERGKVEAYFFARSGEGGLHVEEVGVADPAVCPDVLAACARAALDASAGRLRFLVPPSHAFAHFLIQYKSTHEMSVVRDAGGMMAFVDIGETFESMIPEWESRLARSAARSLRTELTLVVDDACYRVRANRGAVDIAGGSGKNKLSLEPAELMHLLTGYRHIEDVLTPHKGVLAPDARAVLATVFPKRSPYVWPFDRF